MDNDGNSNKYAADRYKYVRRCKRANPNVMTYTITQCGSTPYAAETAYSASSTSKYVDYVMDPNTTPNADVLYRGPALDDGTYWNTQTQYSSSYSYVLG
jgi:hypothetical protein